MKHKLQFAHDLAETLRIEPGEKVSMGALDPGHTAGLTRKADAGPRLAEGVALLGDYQDRLAAQGTGGVLLILQGLDAAGKDGTIKHVMSGVNPQGVEVRSFKQPSVDELAHDFLRRYQRAVPGRGRIGIFNRSHYEEVLVVRVHPELLDAERLPDAAGHLWKRRYRAINDWERYLVENGFRVVKVFLNLSRREQAKRLLERIDRPEKHWKFSIQDMRERARWDDYQQAIGAMLSHTSTKAAPWYVIPADHKWFTRLATAAVLLSTLAEIDPRYPPGAPEVLAEMPRARAALLADLGRPAGS